MSTIVNDVVPITSGLKIWNTPVEEIRPAPENDKLYRPILDTDQATIELAESIEDRGVLEPLVVSDDGYILSGHRRYAAAVIAGLETVPVRFRHDVSRENDPDRFVELLREYNRQRVKTLDEQIREAVIDSDPTEAREELLAHRRDSSKVGLARLSMGAVKTRKRISKGKEPFALAITAVLEGLIEFGPATVRMVHYGLLNDPPLRHSGKRDSRYANDVKSYHDLTDMLLRMRLNGRVPWRWIEDDTRPHTSWAVHAGPGVFVRQELNGFLKGYFRDLMQSQPNYVEVHVEKNTVAGIVRPVCQEFCIPMTSGRGFCSGPPRHKLKERFLQSGKERLVLLIATDFDPSGELIAESYARSIRDDMEIAEVYPIKVALNHEHVAKYNLPHNMEAKNKLRSDGKRDPIAEAFIAKHGSYVWELEAVRPSVLQELFRDAIKSVIDLDLFNREQELEVQDARQLQGVRQTVQRMLSTLSLDGLGGGE